MADWNETNPDNFDGEWMRVWFNFHMRQIAVETVEVSAAVEDAAERLEEIFA